MKSRGSVFKWVRCFIVQKDNRKGNVNDNTMVWMGALLLQIKYRN